jgi:hypothetical protein
MLRSDGHRRFDNNGGGNIEQTGCHTQPKITGTRHNHGPFEIDSELCSSLQTQIRDSYEGDPLSSLRWTRDESRRQAWAVYRVRLTGSELNDSRHAR